MFPLPSPLQAPEQGSEHLNRGGGAGRVARPTNALGDNHMSPVVARLGDRPPRCLGIPVEKVPERGTRGGTAPLSRV